MAALVAAGHSDKYVLHSCDNKLCCNPRHLRYGTQQENLQEMMDKGRWKRTKPATKGYRNHLRGADVWTSTLTESLVRQIWKLHLRGKNAGEIAKITGASNQAIGSLCRGKTWRHLSGAPSVEKLAQGGVRRSKLSESDIKEIRQLIKSGETNVSIAARFGISTAPVSNIRNHGSTWVPKP